MKHKISYLRVVLTEEENYRCMYKGPMKGKIIFTQEEQPMQIDHYKYFIKKFTEKGLKKIKFAGGEPLLYKGLDELIAYSKKCGVDEIGITTNGIGLGGRILDLQKLGLTNVNISVDSLKEYKFNTLTNGGNIKEVFMAIDSCLASNITLKINCVAIKGFNDDELFDFMMLTLNKKLDVRLIELLNLGEAKNIYEQGYLDLKNFVKNIEGIYKVIDDNMSFAKYFKIHEAKGRIGIISNNSEEYKEDNQRVNLNTRGYLCRGFIPYNDLEVLSMSGNDNAFEQIYNRI